MSRPTEIRNIPLSAEEVPTFHVRQLTAFSYQPAADGREESPHRHQYHELLWVKQGRGIQRIDGEAVEIEPGMISLVRQGQVHQFVHATKIDAQIIRFSDDLLPTGGALTERIFQALMTDPDFPVAKLLLNREQVSEVQPLADMIQKEYRRASQPSAPNMLGYLIAALLLSVHRCCLGQQASSLASEHDSSLYRTFVALLESEYRHHHDVAYYADALHVTPRQLSTQVRRVLGVSAKQLIEERLVTEAKRLFRFSTASIKQVAYELGYSDPAYFSRVFKRWTRLSPQQYRYRVS
jgi:AraC family transcriptional activator of pobA